MAFNPLPLRVEHVAGEPGYALLDRLALRHRCLTVGEFVSLIPNRPSRLSNRVAIGEALDELAALAGASVDRLHASSFSSRQGNGRGFIGAIPVGGGSFRRRSGAICTRCIRDDIERRRGPEATRPYRRVWWDLSFIEACPVHSVLLRLDCPACGVTLGRGQLSPRSCACGCDLSSVDETELARIDLAAVRFLVDRIVVPGGISHPVLDRLPLATAASLLFQLGSKQPEIPADPGQQRGGFGPEQRCRIASAGFRVLKAWPENFHTFLDRVVSRSTPGSTAMKVAGRYGDLHRWITTREEPGLEPLIAAMLEHARKMTPINGRARMFGIRDLGSPRMTGAAAAVAAGLSEPETRRIFEHLGLPLLDCRGDAWVAERSDVELAREWAAAHFNRRVAAKELGIKSATLASLQKDGLVKAVIPGDRSRPTFYSRAELLTLLKQATRGASAVSSVPDGSRVLGDFRRSQVSVCFLVAGLASGRLECSGLLEGMPGLSGICIRDPNHSELRSEQSGGSAAVELRAAVVAAIDRGTPLRKAAIQFGVASATAGRWARAAGVARVRIEDFQEEIAAAIQVDVDVSVKKLVKVLWQEHGAKLSSTTVWRYLRREGIRE